MTQKERKAERKRLVDLLMIYDNIRANDWSEEEIESVYGTQADYLISNGGIFPPYKVGDKLFFSGLLTGCNPFEVVSITQEGGKFFIRTRDRYTFEDEYSEEELEKLVCSIQKAEGA